MDKAKVGTVFLFHYIVSIPQITDAVKRYSYLLGQTELFKHFVDIKVSLVAVSLTMRFLNHPREHATQSMLP
jgi:hypothetical protein